MIFIVKGDHSPGVESDQPNMANTKASGIILQHDLTVLTDVKGAKTGMIFILDYTQIFILQLFASSVSYLFKLSKTNKQHAKYKYHILDKDILPFWQQT